MLYAFSYLSPISCIFLLPNASSDSVTLDVRIVQVKSNLFL